MVITDQEFRKIISGTTPFMFDLYRQYNGDKSTTMSPISILLLMSMLANGASGETKKDIMRTLGVSGLSVQELNAICKTLIKELPLTISNHIDVFKCKIPTTRIEYGEVFSECITASPIITNQICIAIADNMYSVLKIYSSSCVRTTI